MLLAGKPVSTLAEYQARGGLEGLAAADRMTPERVVEQVEASGLRAAAEPGSRSERSGDRSAPEAPLPEHGSSLPTGQKANPAASKTAQSSATTPMRWLKAC
jgi:hypothetical protein